MQKRSTGVVRSPSVAAQRQPTIQFRWAWFGFMLALLLALAVGTSRASAAETTYSCEEELGRTCTVTEELAYCVINAFLSYDDCKENGGLLNDLGCYTLYVADYYACYLTTPIEVFIK